MAAWVYILKCADGSYYVGCTTKIEQRIAEHEAGAYPGYISTRRPVTCVWSAEFQSIRDAIDYERKLKRWSRAKKEAVIAGRWNDLPALARSYMFHGKPQASASFDTAAMRPAQDDGQG